VTGPYALWAMHYRQSGWSGVLPVDLNGGVGSVPPGFTGKEHWGVWPDEGQVKAWVQALGEKNVGLRLPDDVIGIDVDCYDGKVGCETLEWYVQNAGALPATWRSTARDDDSAIYFFRVPTGRHWISNLKGIEIIRHGHRWARVMPSVNPKIKRPYRWFDSKGVESMRAPTPVELAELPEEWVDALTTGKLKSGATSPDEKIAQDHQGLNIDEWIAEGPTVVGNQRDHQLKGIGWMRERGYTLLSAAVVAWEVAKTYVNRDPSDPWDQEYVINLVTDMYSRYEGGAITQLSPEQLAAMRNLVGIATPDPAFDKLVGERLSFRKADEAARLTLEQEQLKLARGVRVKRTAEKYAEVEQPTAILNDVLAAEVNLLGGPTEAGKSILTRDWAVAIMTGEEWRGHKPRESRPALLVASEGLHDFDRRWQEHPLWAKFKTLLYVIEEPVDLVRGDDVDWLLKEYAAERPGLVIFDVIYGMGLPDDNGVKDVLPCIIAMKRISAAWDAATLAIGHSGHAESRRFRGSSMWRQLAATEWHMADGSLSCEKSKIADKRTLGAAYVPEYPSLRYLNAGDAVKQAAERAVLVQADVAAYPDDSISKRAGRLAPHLGLAVRSARRVVASVTGEREGDEG
jgi:AAA domain/Bifunctional DNA primase/polymerase, N-terminal